MSNDQAILLVDDDDDFRALTRMALEVMGHPVLEAESAYAALDLIVQEPQPSIGLVLADHKMPGMTGSEMAEELARARPELTVKVWSSFPELAPGVMRKTLESLDNVLESLKAS